MNTLDFYTSSLYINYIATMKNSQMGHALRVDLDHFKYF